MMCNAVDTARWIVHIIADQTARGFEPLIEPAKIAGDTFCSYSRTYKGRHHAYLIQNSYLIQHTHTPHTSLHMQEDHGLVRKRYSYSRKLLFFQKAHLIPEQSIQRVTRHTHNKFVLHQQRHCSQPRNERGIFPFKKSCIPERGASRCSARTTCNQILSPSRTRAQC